jgi:hypothetical protein
MSAPEIAIPAIDPRMFGRLVTSSPDAASIAERL